MYIPHTCSSEQLRAKRLKNPLKVGEQVHNVVSWNFAQDTNCVTCNIFKRELQCIGTLGNRLTEVHLHTSSFGFLLVSWQLTVVHNLLNGIIGEFLPGWLKHISLSIAVYLFAHPYTRTHDNKAHFD